MNNFKNHLKNLKELQFPIGKYAIFGSGPMSVRGLRDSRDLDLIVSGDIFSRLKGSGEWKYKTFDREVRNIEMLEKDEIELYKSWGPGEWDVDKLIKESEIIDGIPFVRLKEVLKWKKISDRNKDRKDIKIIEGYLKTR
jgi:hypothetical protein